MPVNDMDFVQISSILNTLHQAVTGQEPQAVVDTSSFISVATTTLKTGYDPVNKAISQVLGKTIFSNRPYYGKFRGLMMSNEQYGNHFRKVSYGDNDAIDEKAYDLTDGQSVDQQIVQKPKLLQTNWYGANVWTDMQTVFDKQLDCAFSGPAELRQFFVGQLQAVYDKMEQRRETTSRMTLCNLIGGTIKAANAPQVVHLITEYNAETGKSITADDYRSPDNYPDFIRWVSARIMTASDRLTDRLMMYHQNVTGKEIPRHTPYGLQQLYILSSDKNNMLTRVLSTTYHDEMARLAASETLNFWQSPDKPDTINVKASWMGKDGTIQTDSVGTETAGVFAVLFDREAAGITIVNQSAKPAPYNARGEYQNTFWHYTHRYFNDNTENCVVFLLD